ncbi:GNAT family N-acetyltransferase [Rugosimonospora africana]|uniref:N-acetyltransferase n=1 Tax=Rugosimonospora africana TaxID=556532 RepID=A0A8J3QNJ4_9ACTN|nr:GNAT family N-acetyltransferase [Rugosimonospora africana]GIH13756.1 N-acetyltransferase [Rugosimonospora africana]
MTLRFELDPDLTARLRDGIVALWTDVSNAGGAVGFAGTVTAEDVRPTATKTFAGVDGRHDRLLVGFDGDRPVAMLLFVDGRFALAAHWRTVKRVMVHPDVQGRGYGGALMREAERVAREIGWDALHLTVRAGRGTERFYSGLGYKEVGRLPGALRVAPGDDRDEIHMWLTLD